MNTRASLLIWALLATGCGEDAANDAPGGTAGSNSAGSSGVGGMGGMGGTGGMGGSAGGTGAGAASPGCGATRLGPGDHEGTLQHDGLERSYLLHVPAGYEPTSSTPLLLNFHGFTPVVGAQAASAQRGLSRMLDKSDSAGFIVVHPQGQVEEGNAFWNSGGSTDRTGDDVGFIRSLLDELAADLCIDPTRIFATGLSNGGMLSHRLACELSDRIAAIAPVAGSLRVTPCDPPRPVPVIAFHGDADAVVPYVDGEAAVQHWVEHDGCDDSPTETFSNGDSTCQTWSGCDAGAEVSFCTVRDGGHTWPGGNPLPSLPGFETGKTTQDMSANDRLWEFFERHPLP